MTWWTCASIASGEERVSPRPTAPSAVSISSQMLLARLAERIVRTATIVASATRFFAGRHGFGQTTFSRGSPAATRRMFSAIAAKRWRIVPSV